MGYTISQNRKDFESRIKYLIQRSNEAERNSTLSHDIRTMIFQCAIFQTSAALESYIKLMIETWVQRLKDNSKGDLIPESLSGHIYASKIQPAFKKFMINNEESLINKAVHEAHKSWMVLNKVPQIPNYFDGKSIHGSLSYPSLKNIKKFFSRIGIDGILDILSRNMGRDASMVIQGFQDIRTALAHSSPPTVTISDVKRLLNDISSIVRYLDRIMHRHFLSHGGACCWAS